MNGPLAIRLKALIEKNHFLGAERILPAHPSLRLNAIPSLSLQPHTVYLAECELAKPPQSPEPVFTINLSLYHIHIAGRGKNFLLPSPRFRNEGLKIKLPKDD